MSWGNRLTDTKKRSLQERLTILQKEKRLLSDLKDLRVRALSYAPPDAVVALAANTKLPCATLDENLYFAACPSTSLHDHHGRDTQTDSDAFKLDDTWFTRLDLAALDDEELLSLQNRAECFDGILPYGDVLWRYSADELLRQLDTRLSPTALTPWRRLVHHLDSLENMRYSLPHYSTSNAESRQSITPAVPGVVSNSDYPIGELIILQRTILEVRKRQKMLSKRTEEIQRTSRCKSSRWKMAKFRGDTTELLKNKGRASPLTECMSADDDSACKQDEWELMNDRFRRSRPFERRAVLGVLPRVPDHAGTYSKGGSSKEVVW